MEVFKDNHPKIIAMVIFDRQLRFACDPRNSFVIIRKFFSGVVAFNALKRAVYTLPCTDTVVSFKDNHPKTFWINSGKNQP